MPSPWSLSCEPEQITGPFAYMRLLGGWSADNLPMMTPRPTAQADAQAIRWLSERVPVVAFGHAPEAVRQLEEEQRRPR
jgi:hypothetical protein